MQVIYNNLILTNQFCFFPNPRNYQLNLKRHHSRSYIL